MMPHAGDHKLEACNDRLAIRLYCDFEDEVYYPEYFQNFYT
jgi:hypothetical protein